MRAYPLPPQNTRLGLHYFPDTNHYRDSDLRTWLPELRALGISWLTLIASPDYAIPESFLRGLLDQGIEPVLHFPLPLHYNGQNSTRATTAEFGLLFTTYARWGVHYVILFDRPNSNIAWTASSWTQTDLVERFLDRFLPLAETASQTGLIPVFPPLEPGGDYWDTAFLRAALQAMERRGYTDLLHSLTLSAYARAGERPLNWGSGGPESWPSSHPYITPAGSEDQLGFRIFDWYLKIMESVTGNTGQILLLAAGSYPIQKPDHQTLRLDEAAHTLRNLAIAQALMEPVFPQLRPDLFEPLDPIQPQVLAGNFWLLSAAPHSNHLPRAWFQPDGSSLPIAGALSQLIASHNRHLSVKSTNLANTRVYPAQSKPNHRHLIAHYLLLPSYEWGISDWHLDVIRSYVKKYRPTIGFSLAEAAYAARVTVVGGVDIFSEAALTELRAAGCAVEHFDEVGTSIATEVVL